MKFHDNKQVMRMLRDHMNLVAVACIFDEKIYDDLHIDDDIDKNKAFQKFLGEERESGDFIFFYSNEDYVIFLNKLMDATQEGKIRPFEMIFDFVTATTEFQIHT
jgi:hypothetical protein